MNKLFFLPCLVALACTAPESDPSADQSDTTEPAGGIQLTGPTAAGHLPVTHRLPVGWIADETTSSMRLAQYRIGSGTESVCVVYWFGTGVGGSLEANLERWSQQFEAGATITSEQLDVADGISATMLDVRGTYIAEVTPGATERHDEADWAMLAAYLEVPQGPLFLRLVGPAFEVVPQRETFIAWIGSFRPRD